MRGRPTATILALVVAACGSGSGPEADTAWIEVDGEDRIVVEVAECGLDDDTVFVVVAEPEATLQAVVVLDDDGEAVVEEVALSVSLADEGGDRSRTVGAIGAAAAPKLGAGGPAGEVRSASVSGARIQIIVDAEVLDTDQQGTGEPAGTLEVDAHCPATDEA